MSIETSIAMKPGQVWLGLSEFPGYLIGTHGEVASSLSGDMRVLKPIRIGNYDGYQLRRADGKVVKRYRHRLVAEVVYGPCPAGQHCRHLDGDKRNADFTNLRWGTPQENASDKVSHGTDPSGERHGHAILTEANVREMRATRVAGATFAQIAMGFGVSTMTAYRAVVGTSWRNVR